MIIGPFPSPVAELLAVGGKFLGNPSKTTVFPAEMVVDYVRVYEKVGGYGKPTGKCYCMLLRDAYIKVPLRETLMQLLQTGTFSHRCCDAHNRCILFGQVYQSPTINLFDPRYAH